MKFLLPLLFVISSITTAYSQYCTSDERFTEVEYFELSEIDSTTNVVYGNALDRFDVPTDLLIDFYYPKASADPLSERPFVLMIHGGGFQTGNKNDRKGECIALAQRGYVTATMSYRLGWNTLIPSTQLLAIYRAHQDAHAALRYISANAGDYDIDTDWMFIGGSSAGAITANNVVYTDQDEWNTIVPTAESSLGLIDTSGNDLTNTFEINGVFNNWGAVPLATMDVAQMVPQIAFHADGDPTVEIDTSALLMGSRSIHYTLLDNDICSNITVDLSTDHGIYRNLTGAIFRASKTSCFFKSIFCDDCVDVYTNDSIPANCTATAGFEDLDSKQYSIYPNPANDDLNITGLTGNENFSIFSVKGELIVQYTNQESINISALSKGIYFLQIELNQEIEMIRFVKN
ncbi:MAG: T9SS type A sorting domain-containing protein [Crocinitomicaceae bacterium]|nr:T9SS type A sorting domain-containing protein [Crocinitomicaceae bacterium]